LKAGLLYPFINNPGVYKCPADKTQGASGMPRNRSMSMNCWLNPIKSWLTLRTGSPAMRVFTKQTELSPRPGASQTWVFIDENPQSINDGYFVCDPRALTTWVDCPATYHNRAGGLSFADGHAEIKRWSDANVLAPPSKTGTDFPVDPKSSDLIWLQQRSTVAQ
jgi:prepilin-type processing-associated H-X9-DG protein